MLVRARLRQTALSPLKNGLISGASLWFLPCRKMQTMGSPPLPARPICQAFLYYIVPSMLESRWACFDQKSTKLNEILTSCWNPEVVLYPNECIKRKQALITTGVTEGHCSSVTFISVRVWRSHRFQKKTCWLVLLGAGFKDSRGRFNAWGVHHSLNRCEVLLNTPLMQVNQRCAAARSKEKLHVHCTRTTPTPESQDLRH